MFNYNTGMGYSLSDIAAASGNRNNDGFFGENGWWIILLFLFTGWGRGFGGFGGAEAGIAPATQADVRAAVDQQTLISKLDQQTYGLVDSTYALNNTLTNGFHGVDTAVCTLGYNMQSGFNTLAHQMSDCCCGIERGVERGFADTNYNLATQACETRQAIANSTREILDFLVKDKIASLQAENADLRLAASQVRQNAYLINELRPAPVPAYPVANPYCNYAPAFCGCN